MISHSQRKAQKKVQQRATSNQHFEQPPKHSLTSITPPPPPPQLTHSSHRLILLFSFLFLLLLSLFFTSCQCGVETSTTGDKDAVKTVDVDADNDGLIEIHNLAQFHAIRTDLNGDGISDEGVTVDNNFRGSEGCPDGGCEGYELAGDLNFDENGDGEQNDTYNQDDGTWEWEFNPIDTFVGSYEDTINNFPPVVWKFSGCNNDGLIAHNIPQQEHFNYCNGLFQGEVVEALTSGDQYTSRVTIHNGNLPLSNFFSPQSINWTIELAQGVSVPPVTVFQHTYSPYLSFLLPSDASSEDCTDVTNQTEAIANSSYSIRTASCDTNTYNTNSLLFRGKFEYNGYSITWE